MRPASSAEALASSKIARPFDVALAATLHDPPGALAGDLARLLPRLQALYRHVAVATSPPTADGVKRLLAGARAYAGTPAPNLRGPLYRLALRRARAAATGRVHYLDLDRALHWLLRAPRELSAMLRVACRHPVLVVGRTPAAHRSHQLALYATEVLANRLMAERVGVAGRLDLLAPSFVLTDALAARLLARSRARDLAVYGELAALVLGSTPEVAYLECRGLDWETPDRHRRAVRRIGLTAWRRRWDTPAEWALRVGYAAEIVAGFARTAGRWRVAPAVRRIAPRSG
jgi:hypothetical protein